MLDLPAPIRPTSAMVRCAQGGLDGHRTKPRQEIRPRSVALDHRPWRFTRGSGCAPCRAASVSRARAVDGAQPRSPRRRPLFIGRESRSGQVPARPQSALDLWSPRPGVTRPARQPWRPPRLRRSCRPRRLAVPARAAPGAASAAGRPRPPRAGARSPPPAPVQGAALGPARPASPPAATRSGLADLWSGGSADLARPSSRPRPSDPMSPAGARARRPGAGRNAAAPRTGGRATAPGGRRAAPAARWATQPTAERDPRPLRRASRRAALLRDGRRSGDDRRPGRQGLRLGDAAGVRPDGAYWLRLRAFCQARAGKPAPS